MFGMNFVTVYSGRDSARFDALRAALGSAGVKYRYRCYNASARMAMQQTQMPVPYNRAPAVSTEYVASRFLESKELDFYELEVRQKNRVSAMKAFENA